MGISLTRATLAAAVAAGFLASGGVVWTSSRAAFTAQTGNAGNTWTAGTVSLGGNGTSGALFNASALGAGQTGSGCTAVTYQGSLDAAIRVYVAAGDLTGALGQYLDLAVDQGTAGTPGPACTGFTPVSQIYSGTLADFAAAAHDYATGVGTWAPAGNAGATVAYRFTWTVRDDNRAQGTSATVKFTWEAQNT